MVAFFLCLSERQKLLCCGLGNSTGAYAAGAYRNLFNFAGRKLGPDLLEVGHKTTIALVMGVTDIVSDLGLFPANGAFL